MGWNFIEDIRAEKRRKAAMQIVIGAGIGIAVGTLLGILLAPKSGKETREDLVGFAKESAQNIKSAASEVIKKVKKEE